ncbi:tetratricopeptide repeat protein [Streptomyces sp. NPDC004561]
MIVTSARSGLVYALNGQSRHEEAEALAREALAARPANDKFTVVLRSNLARRLNGQGRYEEALEEAESADEVRRGIPEEKCRSLTGAVELTMATAPLGLGRVAQARTLAEAPHDACRARFGPDHHRIAEARASAMHRVAK